MPSISRLIAYKALREWEKTKFDPHIIIAELTGGSIKPEDKAFARELFFGVIKYKRKIDYYAQHYYRSEKLSPKLQPIIRLGFYQLIQNINIPHYAVVSESTELADKYCSKKQAGFVNAVLRNYLREPGKVMLPSKGDRLDQYLGIFYSYPDWLVRRYISRFGYDETEKLLRWCNTAPDLAFFINSYISSAEALEKLLADQAIAFRKSDTIDGYYICDSPQQLLKSSAFSDGLIIIGDPAQGLAPQGLNLRLGETACDLFAAPGGKTAALAGLVRREGSIIAVDLSIKRLKIMKENIRRWQMDNVFIIAGDLLTFASRRKFRYILADVPCSGTGTLRRNPDLRWNLLETDIRKLAQRQRKLIRAAADLLEPKGRLVYSTCSLEPEENINIIVHFLKHNENFRLRRVKELRKFESQPGLYEVWPYRDQADGAFVAVLERVS